jgi:ABC-type transport system substrate-binding protein
VQRYRFLATCIALVLALAACTNPSGIHRCGDGTGDCIGLNEPTPGTRSSPPHARGLVTFGVVGSPATLDPYSPVASDLTYELAVPVYPSLFRFDPRGHPHPYLAAAMKPTPGGVRVRLRIARWSDGHSVTAGDVVRTWQRARAPSGLSRVTSVRVLGKRSVELRGKIRDWKQALATAAYILPRGRPARVSAGPFRVKSYTPGLEMVFTRNRSWWGRARLQTVKVQFVQSVETMLLLLRAGHLDAGAPPSTVNLDDQLAALGVHHSDALGWESIQLRFPDDYLTRAERRSLSAAVHRGALASGFIRDEGRPSTTLHPGPGPAGARGPWSHAAAPGSPVRRRVTLSIPNGDELLELLQRALQIQMAHVAPDLELVGIEPQTFYGPWKLHNPTQIALLRRAGAPGLGGDAAAFKDASALPLFGVVTVVAWRNGLVGLQANPTFDGPLWNVSEWSTTSR